ncbi:hypothetical protein PSTT_07047 [Puccinia striiformis]|uniref:Uncharacterized protein n=1 Tax=Puccinia striiformis TaxID=27350 RepID=A0A2S4VHX2_9BASI|nr:hypothetical protein PSTT_07047 [Puccinia striiformis]
MSYTRNVERTEDGDVAPIAENKRRLIVLVKNHRLRIMSGETGNIGRGVEASCSGKLDSKTEEKYQENFRKAVNKVHELFGVSCSPSWAIAFIIYGTSQSKERSYSVVRNGHAKLEQIAEQVYYSLREIWISDCSSRSEPLSYSKVSQTQKRLENLNSTRLLPFILICQEFFDGICIVDKPIYDNPSTTQVWKKVVKLARLSIRDIDTTIKWLEKSNLDVAKQEWHRTLGLIEKLFTLLITHRNQIYKKFGTVYRSKSKDRYNILKASAIKYVQLGVSVLKICRVYFNNLSRSTSRQSLFFIAPLMEIETKRLEKLERRNQQIGNQVKNFVKSLRSSTIDPRKVLDMTRTLVDSMIESQRNLRQYWSCLLVANHVAIDEGVIEEAFEWLDNWCEMFFLATGNIMKATSLFFTWPSLDQELDTSDEKLV